MMGEMELRGCVIGVKHLGLSGKHRLGSSHSARPFIINKVQAFKIVGFMSYDHSWLPNSICCNKHNVING